jgi:hypothetical protein
MTFFFRLTRGAASIFFEKPGRYWFILSNVYIDRCIIIYSSDWTGKTPKISEEKVKMRQIFGHPSDFSSNSFGCHARLSVVHPNIFGEKLKK